MGEPARPRGPLARGLSRSILEKRDTFASATGASFGGSREKEREMERVTVGEAALVGEEYFFLYTKKRKK